MFLPLVSKYCLHSSSIPDFSFIKYLSKFPVTLCHVYFWILNIELIPDSSCLLNSSRAWMMTQVHPQITCTCTPRFSWHSDPLPGSEQVYIIGHISVSNAEMLWCARFSLAAVAQVVLGKFGPRLIGTRSGPDQTPRSRSRSGIFPKTRDRLVSGPGIPILPETVPDPVWTGTA